MLPILAALALVLPPAPAGSAAAAPAAARPAAVAAQAVSKAAFHDGMRKLWEEHVMWTRLYIVSAAAGLPDVQPTAGRLLQNQVDIGNAIKPFYGDAAGDRLTALLRAHILVAAELVTAAKAGNSAAVQAASARWYANADSIADFLSGANPANWPQATLRAEMHHHLDLTLKEAQARLAGDWTADIAAYDAIELHILGMADVLSGGIVAQFPRKFNQ